MGLEDLTTLDENYPKGNIEPVSVLDNYQRETRAKLKAWGDVEHNLATGHHTVNVNPSFPTIGRLYYDRLTGELRYYTTGPVPPVPGPGVWRSAIQPPFNYILNPEFKMMSNGISSPPCGWTWSAVAGQGIAQESINSMIGKNSIALATSNDNVNSNILSQAMSTANPRFLPIDYWRGRTVSFGAYITSNVANKAYVALYDGVQTVVSPLQSAGAIGWDWCVATMTLSSGATDIVARLVCAPHTIAYSTIFSEPTLVEGAWPSRPIPQGHPQRSHILTFGSPNGNTQAMSGTNYYGPTGRNANAFLVSVIIPYRYCARNLSVFLVNPPGAGQSITFKVRQNSAVDTNIACTISGVSTSGFDNVNSLMGNANDTLSLQTVSSAAPGSTAVSASLYLDELPW